MGEITRLERDLARLDRERSEVVTRLAELRRGLSTARPGGRDVPTTEISAPLPELSPEEKVVLFRSLFLGREDVFAVRWENHRTGRSGYSPKCGNEWVGGLCDKPRVRCGACPNQAFVPLSDRVVLDHLQGRMVVGVYPILKDHTCHFLAGDFDGEGWEQDTLAFAQSCRDQGLDPAIERSRSGSGSHVWIFFDSPVPAYTARALGTRLVTATMERRPELSMSSYDRLFPNQDRVPSGGFGNLIALPLQYHARQEGNTLFLGPDFQPIPDQWGYLRQIERLSTARAEALTRESSSASVFGPGVRGLTTAAFVPTGSILVRDGEHPDRSRHAPPLDDDLSGRTVRIRLTGRVIVEKADLISSSVTRLRRLAIFPNPEFHRRQAMRLSVGRTPRIIDCSEDLGAQLSLPRGSLEDATQLLELAGAQVQIDDARAGGAPLPHAFVGELSPMQVGMVQSMKGHDIGVLVAPPGSGKTVVGTYLIAARARSTLVLVHRSQLLDQWREQLSVFLGVPVKEVGQLGGGRRKRNGILDVAMIQSLAKHDDRDALLESYGHVLVDECHHVPAVSFERVMNSVRARYVTGLTATPERRDGHHPILGFQLGSVRHTTTQRDASRSGIARHRLVVRHTSFQTELVDSRTSIQDLYSALSTDDARNELILDDVITAINEGRSPVILSERTEHLAYLETRLRGFVRNIIVLRGGLTARQRRSVSEQIAALPQDEERLLLATGRFLGEGFDDARLDTLFLTMPVSWKGTLVQYAGRLHRRHRAKEEVRIYDYVDVHVPVLARMYEKRRKGYAAMGYRVG
ncbi:MAG: DEAD/DEAH box helicase [Candidatus Eisenbacteria bacterium]|uniref:DEAD/DEAH box helicase n=1 Tax=Eiseniibacteriota bacterium TaxID=2212470 RepID=A0A956NKA1_UNCEI|nr:DEAD/DEAH box helicase [Candidatus Eisenbacteria bacterium]MCB9466465.1 DEAD/DEAH box helicase family protein [Candidatus Eisenbacteria bacterium]